MSPKISIITPLHIKESFIAETIDSVLAQTMPNWEMIIVENGSKDLGPTIAKKYANKDPRIRYYGAPKIIKGPGAARNFGFHKAKGQWIQLLDADDLLPPEYFHSQLHCAFQNPLADMIFTKYFEMGKNKIKSAAIEPYGWKKPKQIILDYSISCGPCPPVCIMIKKKSFGCCRWLSGRMRSLSWRRYCPLVPLIASRELSLERVHFGDLQISRAWSPQSGSLSCSMG